MKELSNDTTTDAKIKRDVAREREKFLKSVDVKIVNHTEGVSSFNAIIDSRRGIVIK